MSNSKLYVGNLNYQATTEQVRDLFSEFGSVTDVTIIEGKGFGFVTMETDESANKAKETLDGKDFLGRTLRVNDARPSVKRTGQTGGGGGNRPNRGGRSSRY